MVTLKDIARESGLSPGTVSDILNERKGVKYSPQTTEKVRRVADKLGYRRDRVASALRRGRSMTVGVLAPDLLNPFYAAILKRFMVRLRAEGYSVFVQECEPVPEVGPEREALLDLSAHRIDGLFALMVHGPKHQKLIESMGKSGIAVMATGLEEPSTGVDVIDIDFESGAKRLASALYSHGHRSYLFIGDCPWDGQLGLRHDTIADYLSSRGLEGQPGVLKCDHSPEAARDALGAYLDTHERASWPTALIAINDHLATGVVRACRERGLSISDDVSIASFDNTRQGALWPCTLTSVGVCPNQLSDRISNLLVNRLRGMNKPGKRLRFKTQLYERESMGPVPASRPILAVSSVR